MNKRLLFLFGFNILLLSLFFFSSPVYSIKYYSADGIYDIQNVKTYVEDDKYYVRINIDSDVEDLYLSSELIYRQENIVVNEKSVICNNGCEFIIPIKKVFFGSYRIDIYSKYENKYYIQKHNFNLEEPSIFSPNVNISLNKNSFLFDGNYINLSGLIINNNNQFNEIKYLFEIFPKSKPELRQYYNKSCFSNCNFNFKLNPPYILDEYQINLYSQIGETFTNFSIVLNNYDSNINSSLSSNLSLNLNSSLNFDSTLNSTQRLNLSDNFSNYSNQINYKNNSNDNYKNNSTFLDLKPIIYSNSNKIVQGKYNIKLREKNDFKKKLKFLSENISNDLIQPSIYDVDLNSQDITQNDFVDIEINLDEGNVKKIHIKNTKLEDTKIGFEYIEKEKYKQVFNINNNNENTQNQEIYENIENNENIQNNDDIRDIQNNKDYQNNKNIQRESKSDELNENQLNQNQLSKNQLNNIENLNITNIFAINPIVSKEALNYTLDFVATGTALYKCEDYDFELQICEGNFIKLIDTIPGNYYSLNLTPVDPVFVEIFIPYLNVQRGSITATGTALNSAITSVNMSQSIILFSSRTNDATPDDSQFTPSFVSDNSIRFTRYDGATISSTISWQVITSNLFNVQRGEQALAVNTNNINIPINSVNLSNTFVVVYGRCADETSADTQAGFFLGQLTSSTNLYLERGNGNRCAGTVSWQIVSFEGASVQAGSNNFGSTGTVVTNTISQINETNSILFFGTSSIGTDTGADSNLIRGTISSSNQILFTRAAAQTNSDRNIYWYLVSHPYLKIQKGTTTFTNDVTVTINEVSSLNSAFEYSTISNSNGGQTYQNKEYHSILNSITQLFFDKQTTTRTNIADWFVVDFVPPTIDLSKEVILRTATNQNLTSQNLICSFSLGGGANSSIINWFKNSNNILDLYLPFEGGSSNSNYYKDLSSNSLDSTCSNCPVWSSNTGFDGNGAFYFSGSNYLTTTSSIFDLSNQNFTISMWINSQITDANYHGFFGNSGAGVNYRYPGLWVYNFNQIHGGFGTGSNWCNFMTGAVLSSGWNHIVMSFDSKDIKLYVNSNNVFNYSGCSGLTPYATTTIDIGRVDNYFVGRIDDVRLYKLVLDQKSISNLYQNNLDELSSDLTNSGDVWQCKVNAFTSDKIGINYFSNQLLVLNEEGLPPLNISPNTCSQTFGALCSLWPATSEGDNTFDSCPTSVGGAADEHVREVYINTSSAYDGDSVLVTCEFDPYSDGTEEYIYYYNGLVWEQLYAGNPPNANIHNVSVIKQVSNIEGEHWFRCIVDWDGENDECANTGSYYDNDDIKLSVYKKPEPFEITIISPQNITYNTGYITSIFSTNYFSDLFYSIDNSPFVNACYNCNISNFTSLYRDGNYNLTIKAVNFLNNITIFNSIVFSVNTTIPIPERNTSMRTCTSTFGLFCGLWPATSEGDNTFDFCPSSVGGAGDENVIDVYINTSSAYFGDTIEVTCEFDPYSAGSEEYIYYYNNNSVWRQLYSGNPADGNVHNVSVTTTIDSIAGVHWFRCIIDWDGEGDECANVGSYYDNDDASILVIDNTIPEIPFDLFINSPLNATYLTNSINLDFGTTKNANISYSINGGAYILACNNCTFYNQNYTFLSNNNYLVVRAIDYSNSSKIIYKNVSFTINIPITLTPTIENLILHSQNYLNSSYENLICNYNLGSMSNSSIVNWFVNSNSITILNLPFEGNFTNALFDYSTNNYNGIIYGDTFWNSSSGFDGNGSFNFDGNNDYILFGDINELDSIEQFSLSLWFKRNSQTSSTTINNINNVLFSKSSQSFGDNIEIGTSGANIEIYLDNSGSNYFTYNAGIINGNWYHLGIVYDSSKSNELELYLNGNLISSWNTPQGQILSSGSSPVVLGISRTDTANPYGDFNGSIDESMVFDRAISSEMMKNLYDKKYYNLSSSETKETQIWMCQVTPFSYLNKGDSINSNTIEILEDLFRGINLRLNSNMTRIDSNSYNYKIKLQNLNSKPTPKSKNITLYIEVSDFANFTTTNYLSSSWYNIEENSSYLSGFNSTIYVWNIIENNLDDSAFSSNLGELNSSNSFDLELNITTKNNLNNINHTNLSHYFSDLIKIGFE